MKKLFCLILSILSYVGVMSATVNDSKVADKPVKEFKDPDRVRYDGSCMTIDGEDIFIYSAAFHYFRCPQELWVDRFQKIKEAGFNTVETYVPWNWHERNMPEDINDRSQMDFTDLKEWLRMAHEDFGFYTIVRPGPFICAEWSGGAYPRWLAKFGPGEGGLWLRGSDPEHIKWSVHWFDAISEFVADEQITRKPKGEKGVILYQIENEYNAHRAQGKDRFLKALYNSAVDNGIDVPIFTCLTRECRGSGDPVLSQVFDCDNYYVGISDAPSCAHRMANLRRVQPDAPGFVTELQGGWFSLVTGTLSEEHYSDARHFKAVGLMSILGGCTGINYYMYFGGTHFAGWGARGMTTSYDYNAAIRESGAVGEKYMSSKEIGHFINNFEDKLVRSVGGACEFDGAPKELFGGLRVAPDGTKFVFLHNTDPNNPLRGKAKIVPGKFSKPTEPIYNINQDGEKVLITTTDIIDNDSIAIAPFEVEFDLAGLDTKILVIAPDQVASQGDWWPKKQETPVRPSVLPAKVRVTHAQRREDPFSKAEWQAFPDKASLTDLGVNDFRYSLYRSKVKLNAQEVETLNYLLFNMYTRDIVSVTVNGKQAKRLFPEKADAQTWLTRNAWDRIRPDEYDNRFDVSGLLKKGNNEIIVSYESLGHAHGYIPMEELSGIREAGLSDTETQITRKLDWQFAADAAGVTEGWTEPGFNSSKWEKVELDAVCDIPRKGNGIQPVESPDGLFTWYRIEFSLPEQDPDVWIPWLAKINASGNGYMWLNGNNIGRHWEAGPQREYYLPECWLNFGDGEKNVLVLGLRQTANGAFVKAVEIAPYPDSAEVRK